MDPHVSVKIAGKHDLSLYCPFQPPSCRDIPRLVEHTLKWTKRFQLDSLQDLSKGQFSRLACYTAGCLSFEKLALLSDFYTWVFIFDDQLDDKRVLSEIKDQNELCAAVLNLWEGLEPKEASPVLTSGRELYLRIEQMIDKAWMGYVRKHMRLYILSMTDEQENRATGGKLSQEEYINLRRYASASYPAIGLVHGLSGVAPSVIDTPDFSRLSEHVNDHISWSNDILGLEKELAEGNIYNNIVFVLQFNRQVSWDEAFHTAAEMCNSKMKIIEEIGAALGAGKEIGQVYENCSVWVAGHLAWYAHTGRYS